MEHLRQVPDSRIERTRVERLLFFVLNAELPMTTLTPNPALYREAIPQAPNPLGLDGIEFIEYATARPQALGQVLEMMGFRPIARHRSREVML